MVFMGLEKPIEYGRQQIFDPTTAQMVLQAQDQYANALYRDYVRGLEDMKEFNKEYGNFITPILADQEWYNKNVIDKVRGTIQRMYDAGIDPTRSVQGRAAISQLINSIDVGSVNKLRSSRDAANEYIKNRGLLEAKGLYNADFEERYLGHDLSRWDTIGGGQIWDRTSPYTYQDLNQFAGHIFDKMEDSFIGTGSDHYDYYGVSREDRAKALTQHLSDLLSQPLGRFHYENSKAAYESMLGRKLSDDEAMKYWQRDILDSTQEYEHRNRKLNELWKMQQENAARRAAGGGGNSHNTNTAYPWSFAEVVRRNAATSIMGKQIQEYSNNTLAGVRDEMIEFGKQVSKNTGGFSFKYAGKQAYKQKYGQNRYGVQDINNFLAPQGFSVIDERTGTMLMPKEQIGRLRTEEDVISNTVGFRGRTVSSNNNWLDNADIITVTPTTGSYGALMKNKGAARFENQFEMDVVAYKNVPAVDKDGEPLYNSDGTRQMTRKVIGKKRRYLDSHITSTPNAQGTGWLGTVDAKGKINDTPKLSVTNTQDHRYQDAVQGDKAATDAIIKGTGYISDGIPSELPLYGR